MATNVFPRRPFWAALIAVSTAPFILILGIAPFNAAGLGLSPWLWLAVILTSAHVAATAAIFGDADFQPIVRGNPVRFFLLPTILAAGFAIVALTLPASAWNIVLTGMTAWQLHHYQRQSYGIAVFSCKASGISAPAGLSRVIDITTVVGMLGVLANGSSLHFPPGLVESTRYAAIVLYLIPIGWLVWNIRDDPKLTILSRTMIATAVLFLAPALIPANQMVVFWSYSIAHGAQYIIFMLAIGWAAPSRTSALAILGTAVAAGTIAFPLMNQTEFWTAIYLGIAAGHFLIDAKVWKLRELPQRVIIGARFREVLRPSAAATVADTTAEAVGSGRARA